LAEKHNRDALLNLPEHFHNAYLYSKHGNYFLCPETEGIEKKNGKNK